MRLLGIALLVSLAGCGTVTYPAITPDSPAQLVFLDPHLHSIRSLDFGTYGTHPQISGTPDSLRAYADQIGIDYIWLTDHAENLPAPFPETDFIKDGKEYCDVVFYCVNEVTLTSGVYRLLTDPYIGDLSIIHSVNAIETITTGGIDSGNGQIREHQGWLIKFAQMGAKVASMGSSNSHKGEAGAGGLTVIYLESGQTFEQALLLRQTTGIRNREIIPYLYPDGTLKIHKVESETLYEAYLVHVFSNYTVAQDVELIGQQVLTFDTSAIAAYVVVYAKRYPVAITTPIYF